MVGSMAHKVERVALNDFFVRVLVPFVLLVNYAVNYALVFLFS